MIANVYILFRRYEHVQMMMMMMMMLNTWVHVYGVTSVWFCWRPNVQALLLSPDCSIT